MLEGQQARLTQAALETLAVVAYKQPVSRARVSAIRGVNVDGVMRTLLTRGLVEEAGRDGEHGATLYRTTAYFLERIGVQLARRAARAGALPARHGRPRGRAGRDDGSPAPGRRAPAARTRRAAARPTAGRPMREIATDEDGLIRLQKLLAQSGVASRRKCEELMLDGEVEVDGEVVTRLGTKVDPRTAVIRVSGQRLPPVSRARLPRAQQAARGRLDDVRPRGPPHARGLRRRPARAALPRRAARHRHLRPAAAHQRRRLRQQDGAPVLRGRQDLRRRGRRRGHQGHRRDAAGRRRARRRSGHARPRCGSSRRPGTSRSSSW